MSACSTVEKKADTPEAMFKLAEYYEQEDRLDEAIRRYNEIRQKFPYSPFSIEAELRVADCYYKQENFFEAQLSYQGFRDQYPRHEKADYVTFRIGKSFFGQLPSTSDRDLSAAGPSISHFQELQDLYPQSSYLQEAKETQLKAQNMLAEKAQLVADFYYKRKAYLSALERYEELVQITNQENQIKWGIRRAIQSATKWGDLERAKKWEAQFKTRFPNEPRGGDI